jgi:hypothetical protein
MKTSFRLHDVLGIPSKNAAASCAEISEPLIYPFTCYRVNIPTDMAIL